jgi:hypothetical protein
MNEDVYMCLRGPIAELMVNPDPEIYRKYVYVGPDNKSVLYLKFSEITLWRSQERSAILPQVVGGFRSKRFCSQSLRSVCSK